MKYLLLCSFIILMYGQSFAQNKQVTGTITDTSSKQNLVNSSVLLLRAKDSVLYKFTRSDESGKFSFSNLDTGNYVLLITENNYVDYVDHFVLKDASATFNSGNIFMTLKANLLKEVVVRQQLAAMRMKGDTLEYAADSFKVSQGASVEEMLRKLPGIQVDKDGKITAQGETVKKVYVDGEEFFGDDPTLATKNIQADAIDKVQVFDKKSDQATFTGIDDGEKSKAINLKLKDSKKNGYFGKLDLASDFKSKWNNSAMINRFKGKTKLSLYGITSNVGKTGLDWGEQDKYGGSSNMQYDDDFGGYYWSNNGDEFSGGSYNGEGLPKSWSTGLNYSNKWNDDKTTFNGSYRYNKLNSEGAGSTISQSILSDSSFFVNRENSYTFSSRDRHSGNGTYEWQIDSSTSIKATASGYTGTSFSRSNYASSYTNSNNIVVNENNRFTTDNGKTQNGNINLVFRKKFKKTGRSFSLNIGNIYNKNLSEGLLKSLVNYYNADSGSFVRDSITNQKKISNNTVNTFSTKVVYTEPITKKVFVELNYAIRSNTSDSKRLSYDSSSQDKYDKLNNLYSNDYTFNVITNTTGAAFRYNGKIVMGSIGSDAGFTHFYQKDILHDTSYKRDYTNFFPRANLNFKLPGNTRIGFGYNGNTQQPSITQIQPVLDNTNTLFQYLGNPALKQSFTHRFNLNFNRYNVFKQRGMSLWSSFSTTSHAIVTSQFTDTSTGVTKLQYINTNGNYNYYAGFNMSGKIKKLDMYMYGGIDFNGNKYSNIVNNESNITNNNAPSVNIGFGKDKEKKYYISYNYSFGYNFSRSTIQSNLTTNYWTQNHRLNANLTFFKKWEINSDINYDLRQKTKVFTTNNNVFLWNAYFGRRILKNDKAIIKITANDILNQNKGFSRDISSNTVTERNYQIIRRYFMLAFTWNFTKTPGGAPASPSN